MVDLTLPSDKTCAHVLSVRKERYHDGSSPFGFIEIIPRKNESPLFAVLPGDCGAFPRAPIPCDPPPFPG